MRYALIEAAPGVRGMCRFAMRAISVPARITSELRAFKRSRCVGDERRSGSAPLRFPARNDMVRSAQKRLPAEKEEGDKTHRDPSGGELATPLEMPSLLQVRKIDDLFHWVLRKTQESAPRRS